uniref:Uncharacterized protein n=1 Tax=Sinocyclocheilus anshuiensis TaxID=1608454 RepID=A0A671MS02_9TELE
MFEFIKPIRFSGQDYNTLKQEHLQKKALFEDESFPATTSMGPGSMTYCRGPRHNND